MIRAQTVLEEIKVGILAGQGRAYSVGDQIDENRENQRSHSVGNKN